MPASFIPPAPIRALRELTRCRKRLVQGRAQEVNRLHKLLEGMTIKLAVVVSDILGTSGRAMRDTLLAGASVPEGRADLAYGQLRKKHDALAQALPGRVLPHHRILLAQALAHRDFLDGQIAHRGAPIADHLGPFANAVALVQTVPGVSDTAVAAILAEIGTAMGRFPSAKHLARWAGVCPGNKPSGGTRLGERTTSGNVWLKGILTARVGGGTHKRDVSGCTV